MHPIPSRLDVNNKLILNLVFNLSLLPLLMVKHLVITFNPNDPKSYAPKEVPNFDLLAKFLWNPIPEQCFFLVEGVIVARSNSTQFVRDECGPSPCPSSLDAIPILIFNQLACVREAKVTLLRDRDWCNARPSFINRNCFMPN